MVNHNTPPVTQFTRAASAELNRRPADKGADFIADLSDDYLSCRVEGHRFPKLRPGRMARGIRPVRLRDGAFQLTYICTDCGTEKVRTTLPGGGYDATTRNRYRYATGYQAPAGAGRVKADYIDEWDTRVLPLVIPGEQS